MSAFAKVRAAFLERLDPNLQALGISPVGTGPKGDWRQVICPLCEDSNGSCDISVNSGFLKCKQCSQEMELFTWVAQLRNHANTWEACQALAADVGVTIEISKRRGRPPKELTEDVLTQAVNKLWTDETAEPCRAFLARRHIANPEMLTAFGVGFLAGSLIFAQHWPSGQLKKRYRKYTPGAPPHLRWLWSSGKGATQGLWPVFKPTKNARIVLLEGEWDVLSAWIRLLWHKQDLFAYTWTGGVKAIPADGFPDWIKGRTVEICFDNDVFQGPDWSTHVAPNDKKRAEMRMRREAMLETAKVLKLLGCKVILRAIPVDPAVTWGGDLRDWIDAGGRDWKTVPGWSLEEVLEAAKPKPTSTDFNGVYAYAGRPVNFPAVVSTLEEEGITIPVRSQIDCAMGSESYCQRCLVPQKFPGQVIEHAECPDETVAALLSRDPEKVYRKDLLGVPSTCSYMRIKPIDYTTGCCWVAVEDDRDEVSDRELVVISEQSPTLSGEIKVHGTIHHHKKHVVVNASKLEMRESVDIDLRKFAGKLHEICPWKSDDPDKIDASLRERANDLAHHVTHIFGRTALHVAAILLPHSALHFNVDGHRKRGWLDICVIGDTSTGKSMTFQHLFDFHGLGKAHTCMENVSRAGLTMGATSGGGDARMRLKPGLFPRAHRKMLVLDEFHIMVEERQDHPMLHLQSARDQGHVGGIKIYGARQLPAAVRLATISNWIGGRRDAFKFPCEHLLSLYGKPESLRRLDFAVVVEGEPALDSDPVKQRWTSDLEQATILRAWGQNPDHVRITEEALKLAREQVRDWSSFYADELPLFTGAEKLFSLLRVAIAAANAVFSHAEDDLRAVVVRPGHVRWAARWFEECWAGSMYDQYSAAQFAKREVRQPYHVEAQFTCKLDVSMADEALRLLDCFFGSMTLPEMSTYLGKDTHKTLAWASDLVRLGALEKGVARNQYNAVWRLTPGAHRLLKDLLDLANDFPEEFAARVKKLADWVAFKAMNDEPNLIPLHLALEQLRDEWANADRETNIVGGPGSA